MVVVSFEQRYQSGNWQRRRPQAAWNGEDGGDWKIRREPAAGRLGLLRRCFQQRLPPAFWRRTWPGQRG